jgi:formylglycine-generating enzyme required for sulfatase activity
MLTSNTHTDKRVGMLPVVLGAFFLALPSFSESLPVPTEKMTVDLGGGEKMEMAWIPPGEFVMGSPVNEEGRDDDEIQHRVTLTHGFWMGVHEVTQAQWEQVMRTNTVHFKEAGSNAPVEMVSWTDCQRFIRKLNRSVATNLQVEFRLPTEAEWEYACRAGSKTRFNTGGKDADLTNAAWCVSNSQRTTHPVGLKTPNAWGLCDMHGNVYEWCSDWFGEYTAAPVTDPLGPSSGSSRVMRGGSWFNDARRCRAAFRFWGNPEVPANITGLRCVAVPRTP